MHILTRAEILTMARENNDLYRRGHITREQWAANARRYMGYAEVTLGGTDAQTRERRRALYPIPRDRVIRGARDYWADLRKGRLTLGEFQAKHGLIMHLAERVVIH